MNYLPSAKEYKRIHLEYTLLKDKNSPRGKALALKLNRWYNALTAKYGKKPANE